MICRIYKITSNHTNKIYIGKTKQKYLSRRKRDHKCDFKRYNNGNFHYCSSFELLKYNDWKMELIIETEIDTDNEMTELEQYYINQFRNDKNYEVVNVLNPRKRTKEEKQEYHKRYREDNREKIKEKMKYINWIRYDSPKTKLLICDWVNSINDF